MGKWKVTPEKEKFDRTRITGSVSFNGVPSEESKNGDREYDTPIFQSRSISFPLPVTANIGSSWTDCIMLLKRCGSIFEAVNCLRNLECILEQIPRDDRLAFCKEDFESAVAELRGMKALNNPNLLRECVRMQSKFFDLDKVNKLPESIVQTIFSFHAPHKMIDLLTVCKEWKRIGLSKPLWQDLYIQRFIPPELVERVARAKEAELAGEEAVEDGWTPVIHVSIASLRASSNCAQLYRSRVLTPMVMDRVEVMWKGKFRLDDTAIYSGLGWWAAVVVAHREKSMKIRYPGWSDRWEEWVPRNKIRLPVGPDLDSSIKPLDIVEVWCTGEYVPGVWLLCQVKKIKRGKYGFDNVCSTGMLWVDRSRIRVADLSSFTRHNKFLRRSEGPLPRTGRSLLPDSMQSCIIS